MDLLNKSKFTVICGDFNLCYVDDKDNEVTKMLENNGFKQLVDEATHFLGGHIDHVYSNHNTQEYEVDIKLYSPYYLAKDHDAVCIVITKVPEKTAPRIRRYPIRKVG